MHAACSVSGIDISSNFLDDMSKQASGCENWKSIIHGYLTGILTDEFWILCVLYLLYRVLLAELPESL